jgi:hydrogenase-4 component E
VRVADSLFSQLVGLCAGVLLLTGVLLVWRRTKSGSIRLLALQGIALAILVAMIGIHKANIETLAVALLVLMLKGVVLPMLLTRNALRSGIDRDVPFINPTASLLLVALLAILAYVVSRPLASLGSGPAIQVIPVGMALVLIGFLLLATGRHAIAQLVGFLVLDNGIATVAFLTAGGVPLVVELGVLIDVLLVVLILRVLTGRIQTEYGATDLDDLTELRG